MGGHGFQHFPQDLANVNAWKTMFDPYIIVFFLLRIYSVQIHPNELSTGNVLLFPKFYIETPDFIHLHIMTAE